MFHSETNFIYKKRLQYSNHFISLSKLFFWEENLGKRYETPSLLTVFLSIPLKKLHCCESSRAKGD